MLLIFTISCVPEEHLDTETRISDPEVVNAKLWYESQEAKLLNGKGENHRSNSSNPELRPNWNLTKKHTNAAGQEVLEVSLNVNKTMVSRYMMEKFKNHRPRPHQISQNLLMVDKGNGEYDIFIFKIHSETDLSVNTRRDFFNQVNYGKTPSDFSGELVITTINEELIRGWRVNDGKTLMRFRDVKGNKRLNYTNFSGTCGITESESCEVTTSMEYDSFLGEETMSSEINCFYTYQYECIDSEDNSQGPASEEPDPLEGTGGGLEVSEDPPCNTFEDRVNHVINIEGGFVNDPVDNGGATNRGISWPVWNENAQEILGKEPTLTNLENLSAEEAKLIYKAKFWDKIYLDQIIDGDLRYLIFM